MSVIQQVYLPDAKYSIYIKGIKPDEDNPLSGEITLNGNPTRLERHERYHYDKERDMFVTDNYDIPTFFITKFLEENDCIIEKRENHLCALKKLYLNPITKCYQYYILILNSSVAQIVDVILLKGVVHLVEDYPLQLVDIVAYTLN